MSKKNKGKTTVKADDFDDDFLNAEMAKNVVGTAFAAPTPAPKEEKPVDADEDDEEDGAETTTASKDKKKKKKKPAKKEEKAAPEPPLSAAARAILERKQKQAEEEARIKVLREAEEKRIQEEEEAEAAKEKAIQEEKERKRKAKQDKIDKQKASGTYMTKAEKEKARKNQERLDAMKAAGLIPTVQSDAPPVYGKKKKTSQQKCEDNEMEEADDKEQTPVVEVTVAPAVEASGGDDWESEDWEASVNLLAQKAAQITVTSTTSTSASAAEEEDLLELEKRKEQERNKQLGIERLRREEELRIQRELEERERQELDRQKREAAMKKELSKKRRQDREQIARAARTPENLRAAISVIMGHVDTGKTSLLDKIRNTNVQEGEAGGITQQIGATHFPRETLAVQTQAMQASCPFNIKLPGILVIDTPGHESFSNLRNRGSSLCDVAILVVDLMHGLEPQTRESINMLRSKNAPFIIALNKVDRLYGWKRCPDSPIRDALAVQNENTMFEFRDRTDFVKLQLNEMGLNVKLYWENDSPEDTVSLVPTSAHSGEGVPDLIMNVIEYAQNTLVEKLMYMEYLQSTILEVKVIDGLGPTVDIILLNGTLREGDRIVVSTLDGPVITTIRALLTPPPNRESRVKSEYIHHTVLQGAIGIKIVAPDLARAIAGTPIMVINEGDDEEDIKEEVQSDFDKITKISTDSRGVTVHASTLGALEALLQFLQKDCKPPIPVATVNIGTIFKKDILRAAIMHDKGFPEYATILAFDVKVDADAQAYADESNVKIFTADIIYHLFDRFTAHMTALTEARKQEATEKAVFPCVLKIFPNHVFNKKDPIVLGVEITDGTLRVNTPICVPQLGLDCGRVTSIQNNHKEVNSAKKGTTVAIKISCESNPNLTYGRQFDHTHALYSKISRESIDALKDFFKDEVTKEDLQLIVKLKKVFGIGDASGKKRPANANRPQTAEKNKDSAQSAATAGMEVADDSDEDD